MSTHTHTRGGGTRENTSKLRITTQNMGGFKFGIIYSTNIL